MHVIHNVWSNNYFTDLINPSVFQLTTRIHDTSNREMLMNPNVLIDQFSQELRKKTEVKKEGQDNVSIDNYIYRIYIKFMQPT